MEEKEEWKSALLWYVYTNREWITPRISFSLVEHNKTVNNMVPEYLSSRFVFRSETFTYNLRDNDGTLAVPQPCTNFCKKKK